MTGSKIHPGESVGSTGDTAQGQGTSPAAGTGDTQLGLKANMKIQQF